MALLQRLVSRGGVTLTVSDEEMLLSKERESVQKNRERAAEIYYAILSGFVRCAADGETFIPEEKIEEVYGASLARNYPEANELFLNFAKTYWTFKIALENLNVVAEQRVGSQFLVEAELNIASIFFPTSGPITKSYQEREKTQREILKEAGFANIDKFIEGNPILIRAKAKPKGWLKKILGT
jgi:hypothetical protein